MGATNNYLRLNPQPVHLYVLSKYEGVDSLQVLCPALFVDSLWNIATY